MSFSLILASIFLFATTATVYAAPAIDDDGIECKPSISSMTEYPCFGTLQFQCPSASFNIGKTQYVTCSDIQLFWSYNVGNLTMTIETEFTEQRQPFIILFANDSTFRNQMPHFYRIIDGVETEIVTKDEQIILTSDENYQVIMKFQAPANLMFYGASLNYKVRRLQ
ncbi:unnamed protein product [Didymodactylos carnosus]|uniref:Uncharacterized protein n=1 Tax=Didymodactylos carnosus TaxID=1234261 RepID=A0A815Q9M0_9BILA|nr:unnamed protein product [Didymodactylos carnosus]CAF1460216.1 unnamed protein product [Didymodactylos carnosus]CAF4121851.1 unnamed protein product [Didymodactylos carnosus]CAF4330685.1 unnamed protein product [Didymodactylos carnosus]